MAMQAPNLHVINLHWRIPVETVITGQRYMELMWPLNDVFRIRLHEIGSLTYDASFETEADSAIAALPENPSAWQAASPGAWRVLLERHVQMLEVALANALIGNPLITFPPGPALSDDEWRTGLMLLWPFFI
jgi:hypothetical protein